MKMNVYRIFNEIKLVLFFSSIILNASEQFNQVDAFSSATVYHSLKVKPSKVYKNYAIISWSEDHEDKNVEAYGIRWGTQPNVFTDSVNVKRPFIQEVIYNDTLPDLTENTEYYAQFYRNYNHITDYMDFRFNTPLLRTIPPVSILQQTHPSPLNTNTDKTIKTVEIYSASGKHFSNTIIDPGKIFTSFANAIKNPGLYMVFYKNSNRQIVSTEKLIVCR